MENPATWGRAERIVNDIIRQRNSEHQSGEARAGLSLERCITDALRAEGLLTADRPQQGLDEATMAVLHQLRDPFCTVKDRLRETRTISAADYERLVGTFFNGYYKVKQLLQR